MGYLVTMNDTIYEEIMQNPQANYITPNKVLHDNRLTMEEKREVLQRWKAEAIHMQESTAEGFDGGERSHLEEIVEALNTL